MKNKPQKVIASKRTLSHANSMISSNTPLTLAECGGYRSINRDRTIKMGPAMMRGKF